MKNAAQQEAELHEKLTAAHAATPRRGRGNPLAAPEPPPALVAAWAKLPPTERLRRYRAWVQQQRGTPA